MDERLTLTKEQREELEVGYAIYVCPEQMPEWDEKLSEYENIASLSKVQEWAKADAEGRLVVLPCKVGDKVYYVNKHEYLNPEIENTIIKYLYCDNIGFGFGVEVYFCPPCFANYGQSFNFDEIGKTIFLTREEAEAALKGEKNNA